MRLKCVKICHIFGDFAFDFASNDVTFAMLSKWMCDFRHGELNIDDHFHQHFSVVLPHCCLIAPD